VIALDTNVLVRLLTRDDEQAALLAADLVRENPVFVCKTVLLETEWVLRSGYAFAPDAIRGAFVSLFGLPSLEVEDRPAILAALASYGEGIDFADALHLASSNGADGFATFDRDFAKRAARAAGGPAVQTLGWPETGEP
jgi:predicted nucleic-acid-binding protein